MNTLTNMWKDYTLEFSPWQKVIIGAVLAFIFFAVIMAVILLFAQILD